MEKDPTAFKRTVLAYNSEFSKWCRLRTKLYTVLGRREYFKLFTSGDLPYVAEQVYKAGFPSPKL